MARTVRVDPELGNVVRTPIMCTGELLKLHSCGVGSEASGRHRPFTWAGWSVPISKQDIQINQIIGRTKKITWNRPSVRAGLG